jgi:Iron-containing redox enzyme
MLLPEPRGPITQQLQAVGGVDRDKIAAFLDDVDQSVLDSDDVQLALWTLFELHYRGFDDVDPRAEWDPDLVAVRGMLERRFEAELRALTSPAVEAVLSLDESIADRLFRLVRDDDGPRLAAFVQREITAEQFGELLIHRSVYHLKEADPHTFAVPRLTGRAKAALIEIQFDEYGAGRADDMHSALFASTLRACGLDDTYGAYVDSVPGYTLAASNAMSMFGLNRRLRAAAAGHLAAFEATSTLPNRRYAAGARRLGYGDGAARYFDEHVEADAVHEQVAAREMCGALVADDPHCAEDVLFGAATCLALDGLAGRRQLAAWAAGVSSLRPGVGEEPPE